MLAGVDYVARVLLGQPGRLDHPVRLLRRPGPARDPALAAGRREARQAHRLPLGLAAPRRWRPGHPAHRAGRGRRHRGQRRGGGRRLRGLPDVPARDAARRRRRRHRPHRREPGRHLHRGVDRRGDPRPRPRPAACMPGCSPSAATSRRPTPPPPSPPRRTPPSRWASRSSRPRSSRSPCWSFAGTGSTRRCPDDHTDDRCRRPTRCSPRCAPCRPWTCPPTAAARWPTSTTRAWPTRMPWGSRRSRCSPRRTGSTPPRSPRCCGWRTTSSPSPAACSTPRTASPGRSPRAAPSRSCSRCSPPGRARPDDHRPEHGHPDLGARGVPQGGRVPRGARRARRRRPRHPARRPGRDGRGVDDTHGARRRLGARRTPTASSTRSPRSPRWRPSAASAATSTPASAAGCCRTSTTRRRGPSPSRASRASASTCTSTRTRPKGVSVLLHRTPALRRGHFFASANWPGYTMLNSTMQSTRSGGPLAAAWAVTQRIGVEGYARLAHQAREATLAVAAAVDGIPGLRVLTPPDSTLVALVADDSCDVFTVADEMLERGLVRAAADVVRRRAADPAPHPLGGDRPVGARARRGAAGVGGCRARRRSGRGRPRPRRAAGVDRPRHARRRGLRRAARRRRPRRAATARSPCRRRMAPVNALLDACPLPLREALLLGVLDRLSRPTPG